VIAVDTNLLVYAHRASTPEHRAARRAIERATGSAVGWGVAFATVVEFLAVVTHPSHPTPSTATEAGRFLEALTDVGCELWQPGPKFATNLLARAVDLGVSGTRVFDPQIGLTALEHGATEVWTHDAKFVRVPGLKLHDPLQSEGAF
jgi:toxin-antitoxin system PIN domain toxin